MNSVNSVSDGNQNSVNTVNNVSGGSNVNNLNRVISVNIVNNEQAVYSAVLPPYMTVFSIMSVLFLAFLKSTLIANN